MKRYIGLLIFLAVVSAILGWIARGISTLACSDPDYHAHILWNLDVE